MISDAEAVRTVLSGTSATSPRAARRFVLDALARWSLEDVRENLELLTSELVTNVVLHVRGDCELRLRRLPGVVRVEVRDPSPVTPHQRYRGDEEGATGRGLLLIDALAAAWGVDAEGDGKTVWFEMLV